MLNDEELGSEGLKNFLQQVEDTVIRQLVRNSRSHAFDGFQVNWNDPSNLVRTSNEADSCWKLSRAAEVQARTHTWTLLFAGLVPPVSSTSCRCGEEPSGNQGVLELHGGGAGLRLWPVRLRLLKHGFHASRHLNYVCCAGWTMETGARRRLTSAPGTCSVGG